jgi:hypothetical protein
MMPECVDIDNSYTVKQSPHIASPALAGPIPEAIIAAATPARFSQPNKTLFITNFLILYYSGLEHRDDEVYPERKQE